MSNKKIVLPDFLTSKQKEQILKAYKWGKPIIVKGPRGPTGKTTLVNCLRKQGIQAFEAWECLTLILELDQIGSVTHVITIQEN
ncbi:TPA: hypothetical protein IUW36_002650 [Enterococcus faecalis]|uniref:hypothetical protein n=1 Tax=Enterococcus faecalis TaxID=1351 RepID=UPI001F28D80A|nr:hypothetical protein [Enterococcus faecalis]UJQ91632.1 hypothetical protein L2629_08435 [Enterococcus faecalis]HAP4449569.1 hypothetical protein [Enterococcus faecalis]HAP4458671.1 hypothetical protein [Enterococcus faecalis]HAP4461289.1 hypothetical protein [Enterococcus faecalis]HAP4470904.1 hypothetical protein [Enterococcus faecalis]